MAHRVFSATHRVTYADCTLGDHVYYARYLDILEAARGEFFRHLGATCLQWQQAGFAFPVLECQVRYKAMARYDDLLTVDLWVSQLERVRLAFGYRVLTEARALAVEASTAHVCASLEGKPRRLPERLLESLGAYRHVP